VGQICREVVRIGSIVVAVGLGWGCGGKGSESRAAKSDLIATSSKAKSTLAALRERAGAALPKGAAEGFRLVVGGLRPEFGAGSEKASARLLLRRMLPFAPV